MDVLPAAPWVLFCIFTGEFKKRIFSSAFFAG